MFAVIKTGGKQYKVAANDQITVMTLEGEAGAKVTFGEVLALFDGDTHHVGAPHVVGATVAGEIVEQTRGPKVYAFKKRRRKNSKRKRGHKQDLTIVRIVEIVGGDGKRTHAAATLKSDDKHLAAEKSARDAGLDTAKFQKLEKAFGTPDDLEWIHGIGPGIAKKLHEVGVFHFWQVAAMSGEDIEKIEHEVGFSGRAERDHWKQQAQDLIAGKPPVPKHHGHADHKD